MNTRAHTYKVLNYYRKARKSLQWLGPKQTRINASGLACVIRFRQSGYNTTTCIVRTIYLFLPTLHAIKPSLLRRQIFMNEDALYGIILQGNLSAKTRWRSQGELNITRSSVGHTGSAIALLNLVIHKRSWIGIGRPTTNWSISFTVSIMSLIDCSLTPKTTNFSLCWILEWKTWVGEPRYRMLDVLCKGEADWWIKCGKGTRAALPSLEQKTSHISTYTVKLAFDRVKWLLVLLNNCSTTVNHNRRKHG